VEGAAGGLGFLERRMADRVSTTMHLKYYVVDEAYAGKLRTEAAYKDTHVDALGNLKSPKTMLSGVTENISTGGLALVSEVPMAMGTKVVVDITMPSLPRPLRALAEVVHSDSEHGRVVDRTVSTYRASLRIIAINKDDMKRIENYIVEQKIRSRSQ
jgi:c-di-GMP-binding flagellar brake protein YcgR